MNKIGDRDPACLCTPSTLWLERRYDGQWDDGFNDLPLEQRTCLVCKASQTREIQLSSNDQKQFIDR